MPNAEGDDDNHGALQAIDVDASRSELIEALKSCQLYAMQLLAENRTLQQKNADLMAATSKKRRKGGEDNPTGLDYKGEIIRWAKEFLLTQALFIDITAFAANPGEPEPSANPEDQLSTNEAYTQNLTIALYATIPVKFHSLVDAREYGGFAKDFIREHGDGRSSLINVIRKNLPLILKDLNVDPALLLTAGADRSKNDTLTSLLCFPGKKATLYAPVLFPGTTQNMSVCFTGPIVMKVHRLMLFGPSSLSEGGKPAQNSNGMKLGIQDITATSVSAASILTRFVLSPDKEWASKGAISGTEWEADYRAYHKLLVRNFHLPHVKKIFKKIRAFVFAGITVRSTGGPIVVDDSDVEDDINDAMRRFELGTDQANDSDDDMGPDPAAHSTATPPVQAENLSVAGQELGPGAAVAQPEVEAEQAPVPARTRPTRQRNRMQNNP
ncbi:hypothetical protein DFH07DRAFT_850824 [Mycena maculata]|uniref:Uncharacterized protein n=1 Tax=Mycena maculata TaxID=230809 RepID=A0AAD7MRJ8_9AGAR|nr:hypothetical protein DFH07DRAFT_850824 [Mycena maculata]